MPNRSFFSAALVPVALFVSLGACGDDSQRAFNTVVVTTEMHHEWRDVPHRLSELELVASHDMTADEVDIVAQNNGGDFGFFDRSAIRQSFDVWRSRNIASVEGSVLVEIAPSGSLDPETHTATVNHTQAASALIGASDVMAFIRGYRVDTNLFDSPPAFAAEYDPAAGYTTQGLGIQLGAVTMSGDEASCSVFARNSIGEADRLDLNAVITRVTTWVRVDYVLVGAFGRTAATTAERDYTLSYATFGAGTVHERASASTRAMSVGGRAGFANGMVGITGFDYWLNIPGRIDPSCTVVNQPAEENVGEGPGRYVKELALDLGARGYDPVSGIASASLDMLLSNSSDVSEVGNVCLGVRGQVGLLQFDGDATREELSSGEVQLNRAPAVGMPARPLETSLALP